jgi:CheY-like chemotaxis protein
MLPLLLEQADASYAVDAVATPNEAIERAHSTAYDLFILDINLGTTRNGVDLMRELRATPRYRTTPMLACTAYAMPGDTERLREAGFDAYLAKPFNADQLLGNGVGRQECESVICIQHLATSAMPHGRAAG